MQKTLTIRGVPASIKRDGWWLSTTVEDAEGCAPDPAAERRGQRLWQLAALAAIADLLFWGHAPGISLVIFAAAIFAIACWDIRPRRDLIRPGLLLALGALPVIEYVQLLSVMLLASALIAALVWTQMLGAGVGRLLAGSHRFLRAIPQGWAAPFRFPAVRAPRLAPELAPPRMLRRAAGNWAFPVGGALIIASLLMEANPVLARMISFDLDPGTLFLRVLLWTGIAFFFAPLLSPTPAFAAQTGTAPVRQRRLPSFGINAGSVLRALIVFNLLLAVQIITDLSILTGTASLPENISLASYAHRGAYPLLITALLAGAFALAARPFLGEHKLVRPLMLIWLGQNAALYASAMLRLDTYIDAYGMTYLRIYALIWMGVVALGLGLTAWQMLRGHGNGWMLRRAVALGLVTLYLCSFVNFAEIIAAHNLSSDKGMRYTCLLGPMAAGPMNEYGTERPVTSDNFIDAMVSCPSLLRPAIGDWQSWGFRKVRVNRYVDRVWADGQAQ